jgi:lambda family phage portal protein
MNIIDRLLRRAPAPARPAPERPARDVLHRGFDSGNNRRFVGTPRFGNVRHETLAAGQPVQALARQMFANNPWATAAVNALVASLVGAGIRGAGSPEATAAMDAWAPYADADGRTDWYGLEAAAVRSLIVDGEAFLLREHDERGLRLRHLPSEMVDPSYTVTQPGGGYVIGGIEHDARGRRVAYHVFRERPDMLGAYPDRVRVLVENVLHVCRPIGAGQVRGVSWLAPVLLRLRELDILEDALAKGVSVAALHAGFLVDMNGTGEPYDGEDVVAGLEPGAVVRLPSGFDIKFSSPQQAQQTGEFVAHQIRAIAAGLGVPSHMVDGDLRNANYSSLRAGLVAFRQRLEQDQFGTIIPQLVAPVFEWVTGERAAEFYPPAQPWVDPLKDTEATVAAMNAGVMSRRQAVAALGYDIAALDAEIAADRAREAALGLTFGPQPQPAKTKEEPNA